MRLIRLTCFVLLIAVLSWGQQTFPPNTGGGGTGPVWGHITGTLSSQTDLNTALSGKQATLTIGNLTETASSILTVTGGTGAVIGSGLTIQVKKASVSQSGYLDLADWATFNGKQAALGYVPLNPANNLSEVTAASARTNLGLGSFALLSSLASTSLTDTSSLVRTTDTATVTNTMLAGSIANAKLLTSSLTIAGHTVSLGGTQALATSDLSNSSSIVLNNQANTYTAGMKQTFGANGTSAGEGFSGVTSDPSTLIAGDRWFRTDLAQISFYDGAQAKRVATIDQIPSVAPAGYSPSQPLAGCGVEYTTGLTFNIGACSYTINGATYSSPLTAETLAAADLTNDRIDVIGVNNTGAAFVLTGTPSGSPSQPVIDPATQLELTFVYIAASATTPSNVVTDNIFDEGTEWTLTDTTHLALSTTNPNTGTHDVEATAAVLTNGTTLVKPAAGTVDLASRNALVLYLRSKAAWPTGTSGSTAARFLSIFWQNGSTQKGNQVVLRDGTFGFSSSNTTTYQQISIPTSLFGINGIPVTTLKILVSGPSGTSSIGYYLDTITLQGGSSAPALPSTLTNFRGTWSASTAYNANDVVVSGSVGYIALVANTNVAVSTTATWATFGIPADTGDVTGTAGSTAKTVTKLNGTTLSALPTGILKNTTGTGVPSTAVSGTDYVAPAAYGTVTDGSPATWNTGSLALVNAIITLNHATATRALNLSNLTNGATGTLVIKQDSTGGAAMTLGTGCTQKVISNGSGAITITQAASAIDIWTFTYDGTNCYWTAGKNYN